MYTYSLNFHIPSDTEEKRVVNIANGYLVQELEEVKQDPYQNAPHPVYSNDYKAPTEKESIREKVEKIDTKKVKWSVNYIAWFSPLVTQKLLSDANNKQNLAVEVFNAVISADSISFAKVFSIDGN